MSIVFRLAVLLICALPLVACGPQVRTQVTRFHDLPVSPSGASVIVLPSDAQRGSLEWRQYANDISIKLNQLGYRLATRFEDADYAIMFGYMIDGGTTTTRAIPTFGQTGGGTSTTTGTVTGPRGVGSYSGQTTSPTTFGVTGYVPRNDTTFTRLLSVDLFDLRRSTPQNPVKRFEGRASSAGESSSLTEIMPYLIEATFRDFPGPSGQTVTVTVPRR